MPSNFLSYSDFMGQNAGTIKNMEQELRRQEMQQLQGAHSATIGARDEAIDSAYWGGSADLSSYGSWKQAQDKQAAATKFQREIENDVGQVKALNRTQGGGFGSLEGSLAFGVNNSDASKTSLQKYLGQTGEDIAASGDEIQSRLDGVRGDYLKEKALMDKQNADLQKWQSYQDSTKNAANEYWAKVAAQLDPSVPQPTGNMMQDFRNKLQTHGKHFEMRGDPYFARNYDLYKNGQQGGGSFGHQQIAAGDSRYLQNMWDYAKKNGGQGELPGTLQQYIEKQYGAAPAQTGGYTGRLAYGSAGGWDAEQRRREAYKKQHGYGYGELG